MNKASARFSTLWRRWVDVVAGQVNDAAERQHLGALGVMWCLGLAWAPKAAFDMVFSSGIAQLAGALWLMSVALQGFALFWRHKPQEAVHVLLATVPMVMFCHAAAGGGWRSFSLTFVPALAALAFGVLRRTAAVLVAMGLAVLLLVPYSMPSEVAAPLSDLQVLVVFSSHVLCFLAVVMVVDVHRLEGRRSLVAALAEVESLNADLEAEDAALATAADRKATFAAHLSHEIRGPLLGMVSACEALLSRPGVAADDAEMLGVALQSATDLQVVLGDVFDAARINSGRLIMLSGPCDVRGLLQRIEREVSEFARQRGVELLLEVPPRMTPVRTDGDLLERVLRKLVQHAVRVSEGRVTVRGALWRGAVVKLRVDVLVEVDDPESEVRRLRLRAEDELSSATLVGLGVTIADRLAEILGGHVDVGVSIDHQALRLRLDVPVLGGTTDDFLHTPLGQVLLLAPEGDGAGVAGVKRVLVQHGADVAVVRGERDAAELLRSGHADLMLVMWTPGVSPMPAAIAALRGAGLLPKRVVALVPEATPVDRDAAVAAGFVAAVTVPLDLHALQARLAQS